MAEPGHDFPVVFLLFPSKRRAKIKLPISGSDLPHTWMSDAYRGKRYDRHSAIVIQFHPQFLGTDFFNAIEMSSIDSMLKKASRGLWFPPLAADPIGHRMQTMVDKEGASRLIDLLTALNDLSQCLEREPLASELYAVTTNKEAETRIQAICDHIANNLSDPELGHDTLTELADMNSSAFSRFFKQSTGRTVSGYITELRIGLACRLLTDTNESILAISHQSGFANLSNFNRRFRQLRNMTPRDYRARYRTAV